MRLKPEHFDWLGIVCFPFILVCGAIIIQTGELSLWAAKLLIIIGIGGTIIDGTIVYRSFLKRR